MYAYIYLTHFYKYNLLIISLSVVVSNVNHVRVVGDRFDREIENVGTLY